MKITGSTKIKWRLLKLNTVGENCDGWGLLYTNIDRCTNSTFGLLRLVGKNISITESNVAVRESENYFTDWIKPSNWNQLPGLQHHAARRKRETDHLRWQGIVNQ